jgi:hypothetical protein
VILGVLEIHAFFMSKSVEPAVVVLSLVLLVASCLSAINGIDRMTAHDLKLVEAMRTVLSAEHEKRREQGASALPVSTV